MSTLGNIGAGLFRVHRGDYFFQVSAVHLAELVTTGGFQLVKSAAACIPRAV
jgi:hypothetical protein